VLGRRALSQVETMTPDEPIAATIIGTQELSILQESPLITF
jgi:hypothetical protein